jgi:peptidoglycan/xylan/chitin deacetylase (PgdA/CDA1 family)
MSPPAPLRLATLGALALLAFLIPCLPRAAHAGTHTTVSLTFDDGIKDQFTNARPLLRAHGMHGTFYIISGQSNLSGYMSQADISALAADGDEIGGHTVDHPDLTTLSADDVKREICNDRVTLLNWGFPVKNFAYPFGSANASVEQAAAYGRRRRLAGGLPRLRVRRDDPARRRLLHPDAGLDPDHHEPHRDEDARHPGGDARRRLGAARHPPRLRRL